MNDLKPTDPTTTDPARIEQSILALLAKRKATSSICPSEVARDVVGNDEKHWRPQMPHVRAVAVDLARTGVLTITRGDETLDLSTIEGGPIRLRRGPRFPDG